MAGLEPCHPASSSGRFLVPSMRGGPALATITYVMGQSCSERERGYSEISSTISPTRFGFASSATSA